jgi:peptide/nickel transport system permease protein
MALTFALDTRHRPFLGHLYLAVGLSMWVEVAQYRSEVRSLSVQRNGICSGCPRTWDIAMPRIIFRHILPNIIGPIMVIAAADFASAILIEAGLSLVGIGVRPPMPSWGYLCTPLLKKTQVLESGGS